jgi:hypothetical protein
MTYGTKYVNAPLGYAPDIDLAGVSVLEPSVPTLEHLCLLIAGSLLWCS